MRFCVLGPSAFFAGLLSFLLIIDSCSSHDARESLPKTSTAALESSLKAQIPVILAQATQEYNAARSFFERFLFPPSYLQRHCCVVCPLLSML
jgi:hypothetical protein